MVKGSPRVSGGGGGSSAHGVSALRPARGQQTVSAATAHFKKKAGKGQAALAAAIEQSKLDIVRDKDEIYERFMCIRLPENKRIKTEDGRQILSFSLENRSIPEDGDKLKRYLRAFQYGIDAKKSGEGIPCPPKETETKLTRARNRGNRDPQSLRDAAKQREKKHMKQRRNLQMKRATEELNRMKDQRNTVEQEVCEIDGKLSAIFQKLEKLSEVKKSLMLEVRSVCQ